MVLIKRKELDKVAVIAGYKNAFDLFIKFALPILSVLSLAGVFVLLFIPFLPWYTGPIIFLTGIVAALGYPFSKYSGVKRDIHDNLFFFITYAGTISTMKISRDLLFRKIAEGGVFGNISFTFNKIHYLAKKWNLGYADSCRIMAKRTPSRILADFLDRLAVIMDFGQDLEIFMHDEQIAVNQEYEVEYKKSLETIKVLQELFVSLSISFAFLLGIGMLAPLLLEMELETIVLWTGLFLIFVDVAILVIIYNFIPKDDLISKLPDKSFRQKYIDAVFIVCGILSFTLYTGFVFFTDWMLTSVMAFSMIPLVYAGSVANNESGAVLRRNKQFPIYSRVLGSAIKVRNGGVVSALKSTQVHDFGVLNAMSINLYRRLRLGSNKFKAWYLFAVESGSNLIVNYSRIFNESVYLGGNAEKVGEIVSKSVTRQNNLSRLREQLAGGLRGAFYGSLVGLAATLYISLSISTVLVDIFNIPGLDDGLSDLAETIVPSTTSVNTEQVLIYVAVILFIHNAISAWIMKIIDGGSIYGSVIDFVIMVWIVAVLAWIIPPGVDAMLPDLTGMFESATEAS